MGNLVKKLVVLVFLAGSLFGCNKTPTGQDSPQATVAKLQKALTEKDRQAFLECYQDGEKPQKLASAMFDAIQATLSFNDALKEKRNTEWEIFEAVEIKHDHVWWLVPPSTNPTALTQCDYQTKDDEIVVRGPGIWGGLKKTGGAWRISLEMFDGREENWAVNFSRLTKALNNNLKAAMDPTVDLKDLKGRVVTQANPDAEGDRK